MLPDMACYTAQRGGDRREMFSSGEDLRSNFVHVIAALIFFLAPAAVLALPAASQTPREPQTIIKVSTREVLLDLVVRDKRDRLVRDLKPNEVEIFEDDVPQKMTSFRLRDETAASRGAEPANPAGATSNALDPLRQISLVSIVFDRLNPAERAMARQAVRSLLSKPLPRNTYLAVFVLDARLNAIQPFTADAGLIEKAVERASTGLYSQYSADSEKILTQLEEHRLQGLAGPGGYVDNALHSLMINLLMDELRTSRYQQGSRQIEALTTLARQQRALPGRKTVLYFSRGLGVPQDLKDTFRNLMSVANRNNVSFYTFDLRGLRTASALDPQAMETQAILMSQGDSTPLSVGEDLIETQSHLSELAESTGGFLTANSNDLTVPMQRVLDQVKSHYEISYLPAAGSDDGHFRKIRLKLARAGLQVQTRNGYYALPMVAGETLAPYEVGLLNAIETQPLPQAVAFHSTVLQFPGSGNRTACSLVFEVPLEKLKPEVVDDKTIGMRIALLALVRDGNGQVVKKLSADLPFRVSRENQDALRKGNFINIQSLDLDPGRYTVDEAVLDRQASIAGARRYSLFVPQASRPALSSIVLTRRVDALAGPINRFNPLEFSGGKVVPSVLNEVAGGPGSKALLYFIVSPLAGSSAKPQLTLAVLSDEKIVARTTLELPAPDEGGMIPYLAAIPVENLPSGEYEVQVTVRQGTSSVQQRCRFVLMEKGSER